MNSAIFRVVTLVAACVLVLAAACGNDSDGDADTSLSRAEVEDIVRSEMANSAQPALTVADVERIAQTAVADRLTYEDVESIMRDSMADMAAMTPGDGGLARADVDAMIRAAMDAAPSPEPSLTREEVERIVQEAIAAIPQSPEPEPGLSRTEVERIARAAIPPMPPPIPPEPSLSRAEVAQIAQRVAASIPSRTEQAEYTKFFVDNAIAIYQADGLDDTLSYYNSPESVDGQWYVFIIDEDGEVISHHNPEILGQNLNGRLGTDSTGYTFGPEILSATESGKWVSYVSSNNPTTGERSSKHSWVVRHDGLLFGSGWHSEGN